MVSQEKHAWTFEVNMKSEAVRLVPGLGSSPQPVRRQVCDQHPVRTLDSKIQIGFPEQSHNTNVCRCVGGKKDEPLQFLHKQGEGACVELFFAAPALTSSRHPLL